MRISDWSSDVCSSDLGILTALPLTLADGLGEDMRRLKRFRTMLNSTAANMAPLQGEYLGGPIPHMLMVGRRGQPFFWRSEERRVGKECFRPCRSWWSPCTQKNKKSKNYEPINK